MKKKKKNFEISIIKHSRDVVKKMFGIRIMRYDLIFHFKAIQKKKITWK